MFVRGKATYSANLNPTNPVGTVQSIEHTLRSLDKFAADQQIQLQRTEKELADYKSQADRPFEHQQKLTELLKRQSELTQMLELDKGDHQAIAPDPDATTAREPQSINDSAALYMRESRGAIKDLEITQRTAPESGSVVGKAVARVGTEVAIATAANSFVVVQLNGSASEVTIGNKIRISMQGGIAKPDKNSGLER